LLPEVILGMAEVVVEELVVQVVEVAEAAQV
jgi:hypothetical protein